jgi:very-short-patch-repair endonuclease
VTSHLEFPGLARLPAANFHRAGIENVRNPENCAPEIPGSIFQSSLSLETKLDRARTELLDLAAKNRLLNIPRSGKSAKIVEVIDEQTHHIFRLLVREGKPFSFLPGRSSSDAGASEDDEIQDLAQPEEDALNESGIAIRHVDTKLQTRLTPAGLQKRLLDLYHDARTLEEEQGVNILFLALGTLKWIDPNNASNERYAPLVLIPVSLERGNAAEKFKLKWRQEDPAPNLSLEAYLDRIHSLKMPAFDGDESFDPITYIAAVRDTVTSKSGWTVNENDIVLGFFSFAKFLMYRDLDPENWPSGAKLSDHAIVKSLISNGFDPSPALVGEDEPIDPQIPPAQMTHIVDSDSSQALAIHEVRSGRSLVIQGPPGTGKSQTIANIIAAAVADGKSVLFVAEKMAALEVVKRRLDNTGVGDACLELHSNKTNKRAVLEELRRTWELGAPKPHNTNSLNVRLAEARETLNAHANRLHQPLGLGGFTPYQVVGHITRLRQKGQGPTDITLAFAERWSADELAARSVLVTELAERVAEIGSPSQHLWRGVGLTVVLPMDVERLAVRIGTLRNSLADLVDRCATLAQMLEKSAPDTLADLDALHAFSLRLATAPDLEGAALGAPAWQDRGREILTLLTAGVGHRALAASLMPVFQDEAWSFDTAPLIEIFQRLPADFALDAFQRIEQLTEMLPTLAAETAALSSMLGRAEVVLNLREILGLAAVGERVAAAPTVDLNAFAADVWDTAVERAADLAVAVETLEDARAQIGHALTEDVWAADLARERRVLAGRGTDLLRFLSGEWRAANRLVRSYLTASKTPLDRQLALLDALAKGQAALATIRSETSFGQSAFAGDWRGDRSKAQPLLSLVEWMRSLRGIGSEPRLVASRGPNRANIGACAERVSNIARDAQRMLTVLWEEAGIFKAALFGAAPDSSLTALPEIQPLLLEVHEAHKAFQKIARQVDPEISNRVKALQDLAAGQTALAEIRNNHTLGELAFGDAWLAEGSDWERLGAASAWIMHNLDIHALASRVERRNALPALLDEARRAREQFLDDVVTLLENLKADETCAIRAQSARGELIAKVFACLTAWHARTEEISKWVDYRARAAQATRLGLGEIVQRLHEDRLAPDAALSSFEMTYFEKVFSEQARAYPELAHFDGDLHDRTVAGFVSLDTQRIKHAAVEVVKAHYGRIPSPLGGALGPLGVLKSEIARKRGHMPIRQLIQKAAAAVQALKPVFMMSPLSVAQFLPPGALTFDLLVMDEASQIQPVDALGAIARAKQVVVVGDPQQLPPTSFFTKMTSGAADEDNDDDARARVGDIECILGLFTARGLPMRMLRWHYRSRHQSLIAVSNRQFYENKLFIVPSPYTQQAGLGLRFHHVADGLFETGTTRTNPIEAKLVAKAIITHAIENPQQTLGVVAFSVAQRRAILDQLELLRRSLDPKYEAFFQAHPAEPFFVKNLENVQGDERDVIFISVGYGPAAPGQRPPMRFGPLGMEGGERRLNVLISRAKRRCDVFSSMTDEDIDPDFAGTRKGVFAFKMFMHFARTGRIAMVEHTARDHIDVFEEQVAEALHERGYQVHRRIGVAGIFVDLAVTDPEHPGRYIMGIECDGGSYSAARSARDRDRLRKSVLEDHGWNIYRIWAIDWFRRPREQLERLVTAIEAAKSELAAAERRQPASLEIITVERGDITEMELVVDSAGSASNKLYVEAELSRPSQCEELHEAPLGVLSMLAEQVVVTESPVHFEEIVARLRDAWGLKRSGSRITDAVERALAVGLAKRRVEKEGKFYSIPGAMPVVRDRSGVKSATLRKPETLPPAEIKVSVVNLISENFGATVDQVVAACGRNLGFKAVSAQLRDLITGIVDDLVREDVLVQKDGMVDLGLHAPPREGRAIAPLPIETLLAEGESERLEFKQTLRWDIRQQTVNKKLEEVAVKTVAAFANHSGGTLLIGVSDEGEITGLDADFACLGGNQDKMELHLTDLLNSHFSHVFRARKIRVSFPLLHDKLICRVDVEKSQKPMFVNLGDRNGNIAERLFVRLGNSSHEIPVSQIAAFVNERFGQA